MMMSKKKTGRTVKLTTPFLLLFALAALMCVLLFATMAHTPSSLFSTLDVNYSTSQNDHHRLFVPKEEEEEDSRIQQQKGALSHNNNQLDQQDSSTFSSSSSMLVLGCLTERCIQQLAATIARPFPSRPVHSPTAASSWCVAKSSSSNRKQGDEQPEFAGILLTKVPKAASSTSAGVALRIANRRNCHAVEWQHRLATEFRLFRKSTTAAVSKFFLFTTIREPAARAISTIFFHVLNRQNVTATDELLVHLLRTYNHSHLGAISTGQGGFQLRYTSLNEIESYSAWNPAAPETVINPIAVVANVKGVVNDYDFILVPERMDESLTAMALVMGIDVDDVLVTSSKVAGSRFHMLHPNKTTFRCIQTAKSVVSDHVRDGFLQSNEWRAMNYGDYLLHEAARQSLDLTIQHVIGRKQFDAALVRYRQLQSLESQQCAPHVQFPCSDAGQPQLEIARKNCYLYYYDFGCGYPCIDDMIANFDAAPPTK